MGGGSRGIDREHGGELAFFAEATGEHDACSFVDGSARGGEVHGLEVSCGGGLRGGVGVAGCG